VLNRTLMLDGPLRGEVRLTSTRWYDTVNDCVDVDDGHGYLTQTTYRIERIRLFSPKDIYVGYSGDEPSEDDMADLLLNDLAKGLRDG